MLSELQYELDQTRSRLTQAETEVSYTAYSPPSFDLPPSIFHLQTS
jgi:hypothetical protein